MDFITVTAKTVDEAVNKALIELGVPSDKLEYEVIEKGSTGFLGFGAKQAVIRAKKKEGADDLEALEEEVKAPILEAEKEAVLQKKQLRKRAVPRLWRTSSMRRKKSRRSRREDFLPKRQRRLKRPQLHFSPRCSAP